MADSLRAKFRQWQVLFLAIPAALLLLIVAFLIGARLQWEHQQPLKSFSAAAYSRLDQALQKESARLGTLANQSTVVGLLTVSQRRDTADEKPEDIEFNWGNAARDNLMVRGVLDNDAAAAFSLMMKQEPALVRLVLVDNRGRLLAATDKPARYFQNESSWWRHARSVPAGQPSAENIESSGLLRLVTPVLRPGISNLVDGLLMAEIELARLLDRDDFIESAGDVIFLAGKTNVPVAGEAALLSRAQDSIAPFLRGGVAEGWAGEFQFRAQPLLSGIAWRDPVLLVSAQQKARLAPRTLLGVVAVLLVGGGVIAGLFFLGRKLGDTWLLKPLREAAEAGLWILRVAFAAEEPKRPVLQQSWAEAITERTSSIQRELTRWLNKWKQELQSQDVNFSAELKRDLEMATEFQQAFLNRPYPQIPEVHIEGRLRLEFNHRYQPALAMGGDFFDITPLGSDCAGVLVADVMGHGMRSALIVSILRTLIAELSRRGRNAPHFMRELNTNFCTMLQTLPSPFFASASYFVADTTSRIATYSLAGHPPPFFLHRAVGRVTRLDIPQPQGAAMGLLPGEEYSGGTVRLNAGDAFLFFTDGVYEAANSAGEEFGLARLEKILRTHVYRSSNEILDAVIRGIHEFAGGEPVADDICMVMVDVTTHAPKKT